jgi:hypothetical protein
MNKTIYMTYKKDVPPKVFDRWTDLNKDYKIDFSMDEQCIQFLETHFNEYITTLFKTIPQGMYKADLWRLCKLYINGGVYADVDLVPYINIDTLDKDVTFYSCLSICKNAIFQAFMVNFYKPKNPLILHFLISFLLNNPHTYNIGPCIDMYNCIQYNLNGIELVPEKKYEIETVKILVHIGKSDNSTKNINLYYFPNDIEYSIECNNLFDVKIINNILVVNYTKNTGWDIDLSCDICIKSKESIYLFKEYIPSNGNWVTAYVSNNNVKILDGHDIEYVNNKGW